MASLRELLAAKQAGAATQAPAPAHPAHGIVIRPPAQTAPAPTVTAAEPRPLGDTSARSADVPFEFASEKPSEAAKEWLAARHAPATKLGVWLEPAPSCHAWLAVDHPEESGRLILLHRLPLFNRQGDGVPF